MNYLKIAKRLGLDQDVKPSEGMIKDSKLININPREVIIKARLAMFTVLIGCAICLSIILTNILGTIISIGPAILIYYYLTERPKIKARNERLKSLGQAPEIITVLGTSLELNPNLERAVRITGEACSGRISKELSVAYKNSLIKGIPLKDSFKEIISEWGNYSEGFRQGMQLINTSLLERESREQTISNGMNAFFNNLINDLRKFLSKTKTHTLILFSFGTIIPLILISMIPIINLLNIESNPIMISTFLTLNLIGIHYYSSYILNHRPATFSQLDIKQEKGFATPIYAIILFLIISSPSLLYYGARLIGGEFPIPTEYASIPLILGLAIPLSIYYHVNSSKLVKKRAKAVRAEQEILDITYTIGSKLQEKRSFEDVLKHTVIENKGKELTKHLRKAYTNIKDLRRQPEEAVMNEVAKTGSRRVISVFKLLFHALRQGVEKSAKSVFRVYEHFNKMIQAEEEHKAMLEQVLSMMRVTALVFAPIISAFIVIMQGIIEANVTNTSVQGLGLNFGSGIGLDVMQLILGYYSIGLVIVLTNYYVKLKYGPDNVMLKHELARSIAIATTIYLSALIMPSLI